MFLLGLRVVYEELKSYHRTMSHEIIAENEKVSAPGPKPIFSVAFGMSINLSVFPFPHLCYCTTFPTTSYVGRGAVGEIR